MNIKECLEKGYLKKDKPDIAKAKQSLKIAEDKFDGALKAFEAELFESTIVFAYMAMFHSARSLLFKDGFIEKSHLAVIAFLKEKYENIIGKKLIYEFNTVRIARHDSLYGLDTNFSNVEAKHILNISQEFINKIKSLIS